MDFAFRGVYSLSQLCILQIPLIPQNLLIFPSISAKVINFPPIFVQFRFLLNLRFFLPSHYAFMHPVLPVLDAPGCFELSLGLGDSSWGQDRPRKRSSCEYLHFMTSLGSGFTGLSPLK